MMTTDLDWVRAYIEQHIGKFHASKLAGLRKQKLSTLLLKKNPYLFRTKHLQDAHDLVKAILDAMISSQEETMFGKFLEELAINVSENLYGGRKSGIKSVDLEFEREGAKYLVSIKSGPNWGNSSQLDKLSKDFKSATITLRQGADKLHIVFVNGCSYGRVANPEKGDYLKLCGQAFWEFLSGNSELYLQIIEPLGYQAKERSEEFISMYNTMINLFTAEFTRDYCTEGRIDWAKLVKFNSSKEKPKPPPKTKRTATRKSR